MQYEEISSPARLIKPRALTCSCGNSFDSGSAKVGPAHHVQLIELQTENFISIKIS
jgi:hypothetical protein